MRPTVCLFATLFACVAFAQTAEDALRSPAAYDSYRQVVLATQGMTQDATARALALKHGLKILDVTWEDTGRFKNSSVGPNISDMTIQVQLMDPRTEQFSLHCMPVIRYPNFSDKTGDVKLDAFHVLVGNEDGESLRRVTLRELLGNLRDYLHEPDSWKGSKKSLLKEPFLFMGGESHVLVSAQACFLPVPKQGIAEFNPVLFNYQSTQGDPAVLTILATREGTSVTVIDNTRDRFQAGHTWGQRLFFNKDGKRAVFTGRRASEFIRESQGRSSHPPSPTVGPESTEGLNMVLLIQVPLKQKSPPGRGGGLFEGLAETDSVAPSASANDMKRERKSDVEEAVIGHGRVEGPFTEIDDLDIERDTRFPIRVTVQFYQATSNGVVNADNLEKIAKQIERVYADADYVGSLVTEGETGRPTEYKDAPKHEYPGWWNEFWLRHEKNTNISREQWMEILRKFRGPNWTPKTQAELEAALREVQ